MKNFLQFSGLNDEQRKRVLLAIPVVILLTTLAYCNLQKPASTVSSSDLATGSLNSNEDADSQDADKDGVTGSLDDCPNEPGAAIDNGCPIDTDGDGIVDLEDQCPTRVGSIDGCPEDDDKDGLVNTEDDCPDMAGSLANKGCPIDSDGDGVGDAIDRCPQTVGNPANDGCTDTNADTDAGTADADDSAQDAATRSNNQGLNARPEPATAKARAAGLAGAGIEECTGDTANDECNPRADNENLSIDVDGDGVPNDADKCPQISGPESSHGCPSDSDGDGVADINDLCPTVVGDPDARGCQADAKITLDASDQQILDEALAKVAFNSNSATLTPESSNILKEVAGLLHKYPTAILEIRGHTDASGSADKNMQLSMDRARSSAALIVSEGIIVSRMRAFGFGESKPVADNNSIEGRRKNRRVEFELLFSN